MKKCLNILIIIIILILPLGIEAEQNNFIISGEGKIRLRDVEANTDQIIGAYGEELKQGLSLRQRIDISLDVFLTDYMNVGGSVRITNEESADILLPPDFISTKAIAGWWTANLYKGPFDLVMGAYDVSFTPLTLMRWDPNDNPLGAAGCACQISVGGISGESLEELQEEYKFEGVKSTIQGGLGDITLLFARPELANEQETFSRHMYGTRGRIILPYTKNYSSLTIGVTGLRVEDDINSVDQATYDPLRSDVLGTDINLPLFWHISAIAEYARSIRDDNLLSTVDIIRAENGIIGGLKVSGGDYIDANLLYLQMDPYFSPLYRAISYAKNRKGYRFSFIYRKLSLLTHMLTLSCYLKKLDEIKPTWNNAIIDWHNSLSDYLVANFGINLAAFDNFKLEGTYEYRNTQRPDDNLTSAVETLDDQTYITSMIITYEFTLQTKIMFKYQYVKHVDDIGDTDYKAHMPMLQLAVKF